MEHGEKDVRNKAKRASQLLILSFHEHSITKSRNQTHRFVKAICAQHLLTKPMNISLNCNDKKKNDMQIIKGTLIAYILPENSLIYEIIYLEGGK